MELIERKAEHVFVVELKGRFDAYEAPKFKSWLEQNIQQDEADLVVNLSGANFIDSTALATLVQAMKRCRQNGGDCHLSNLQQPVRIIFELTRLDRAFDIYRTEADAIESFAPERSRPEAWR